MFELIVFLINSISFVYNFQKGWIYIFHIFIFSHFFDFIDFSMYSDVEYEQKYLFEKIFFYLQTKDSINEFKIYVLSLFL